MRITTGGTGLGALLVAGLLAGCAGVDVDAAGEAVPTYAEAELAAYRFYQSGLTMPFVAEGPVTAVASSGSGMDTYVLVPCRNGTAICAGSTAGPAGNVRTTEDYVVVAGLYGVELWLSPGGDGAVLYPSGAAVPLAWE
ncbi:hypothetical protein [Pseudoroseicyclus tamaricis]|uniref:Lipoprotein n=1 Tax=Pseudoroseicyclus tamaricis TaxID=2705421 RepID=A0A6B2K718_9RHOB|nr:hypothetical protein [Pseudoroseicyclus tamaricis]NDV02746.1 hypothetical protein [Pseudoroseicyclus tamaricis]